MNSYHPGPSGSTRGAADPFVRRAAAVTALVAAVAVLLLFLWTVAHVLLLVFAGVLFAVLLHGLARRLAARVPIGYGWALLATCLSLVGVLVLAVWLIAPQVAAQVGQIGDVVPASVSQLEAQLRQLGLGSSVIERLPSPQELLAGQDGFWTRLTGFVSAAVGILANVLVILVVGLYLAANPGLYRRGLVRLVPAGEEARARETLGALGQALWGWLTGQLVSMTIIGVLVWLGLTLLGVPLALGLGFIAGLTEFVPLIGPWAGAVPGLLVASMEGPTTALYVALLYLAVQQVESNVVTPLVMKKAVSLPPALTIAATLIGGSLFGVAGILLATPLMVAAMVLVEKVYVEGVLGKPSGAPG